MLIDLHAEIHLRRHRDVRCQIRSGGQHLVEGELNARVGGDTRSPIGGEHSRHTGRVLRLEHEGRRTKQSGTVRLRIGDAESVQSVQLQRRAGTHGEFRARPRNFHIRHRRDPQIAGQLLGGGLTARADSENTVGGDHTPLGRAVGHGDLPQGLGNARLGTLHLNGVVHGNDDHVLFFLPLVRDNGFAGRQRRHRKDRTKNTGKDAFTHLFHSVCSFYRMCTSVRRK